MNKNKSCSLPKIVSPNFKLILNSSKHLLLHTDDPYYCGLRARIPNFAKSKAQKEKEASKYAYTQQHQQQQAISPPSALPGQVPPHHPMMWHRGYLDNGKNNGKII